MDHACSRRTFVQNIAVIGGTLPLLSCAHRIRPARSPRVGFIIGTGYDSNVAAFKEELRKLGYNEGENLVIEARYTQPNSNDLPRMAAELTGLGVDVIVAASLPIALAVRNANPQMPMVVATCPGMVSNGFAQSLEHPGGNVTGMDELPPGLTGKRMKLLKAAAPAATRIALLSTTPGRGGHEAQMADAMEAAGPLGVQIKGYRVRAFEELALALTAIAADGMQGLVNFQGGLSLTNRQMIVDFANEHRLSAIYQATLFAEAGGLMAWAPDLIQQFRIAARFVDQILRGARPGDLPIKHPERYYLTINARTATRIGLELPPALLAQAHRVLT